MKTIGLIALRIQTLTLKKKTNDYEADSDKEIWVKNVRFQITDGSYQKSDVRIKFPLKR